MEQAPLHPENEMYRSAKERVAVFFLVAVGVFTLTYAVFFLIDFLPEKPEESAISNDQGLIVVSQPESHEALPPRVVDPLPMRIIIDALDKDIAVSNPETRDVAELDKALLSGVVRHPDSADFANAGTIFLLGHSSYLPHVINKNFQAFNGIQKLTWGDKIKVRSTDTEYVYRVDRVYEAKASDAEVAIERGEATLTLATCDSFGSKDDRFIVEATLVDQYAI